MFGGINIFITKTFTQGSLSLKCESRPLLGMVFIKKPKAKMLPEHPRKVLAIVNIHMELEKDFYVTRFREFIGISLCIKLGKTSNINSAIFLE